MGAKFIFVLFGLFWILNPLNAADYFWVGGSGNWSDINHWVTTSGGTVQHNTIPTSSDDVFFDANSFNGPNQTVTVNNPTIFLRDMDWSGATGQPVFLGPDNFVIEFYGSVILIPEMEFRFQGDIFFKSSESDNKIDLAGHKFWRNTFFSGTGGEWILESSFEGDSLIQFESGIFKSADKAIKCEFLRIVPIGPLNITFENSHITLTGLPYMQLGILQPVADIKFQTPLSFNAENAILEFNSTDVYLQIVNSSNLKIGTIVFSSTVGKSLLKKDALSSNLNIGTLTMLNDTELIGSMKINTLDLGAGKNFKFNSGDVFELTELKANGTCNTPIQLLSTEPGKAAIFKSSSENILGSFLTLRDIHGTGSAIYTANNSDDLGNNMGWTFSPKTNDKLYWVGGAGNWNNPNNWAFNSGGAGGACVPTAGVDVFFDENSFQSPGQVVTIDVDNAYCRSMDWTGVTANPILSGTNEKNIHIFGSFKLNTNMQLNFEGDVLFESNDTGNLIATYDQEFKKNTVFNGQGDWTLVDNFLVIKSILFVQGKLNTNDQVLGCEIFNSDSQLPRILQLGNSHIQLKSPDNRMWTDWIIRSNNMVFDAGNSLIEFLYFGSLRHTGTPPLNYHKVKFNFNGNVFGTKKQLKNIIDTLEMLGSGTFFGNTKMNTWIINRGTLYEVSEGDTLIIQNIIPKEGCDKLIEFRSDHPYKPAYITHQLNLTLNNIAVQDIHSIGPGILSANSSANIRNSDGWVINESDGRTLFWVGGSGLWHDQAHWSLSSGGVGGECVPTPIDDVIFDENSFSAPDQRVGMNVEFAYCKNIIWRNLPFRTIFQSERLNVFGSIETDQNLFFGRFFNLVLRSENSDNRIKIGASGIISFFDITGGGSFILQDSLQAFRLLHGNGTFQSNGYGVNIVEYTNWFWDTKKELNLGESHWKVSGSGLIGRPPSWYNIRPMIFRPEASLVEFTSPTAKILSEVPFEFNNVLFSAVDQQSKIEALNNATGIFNRLEFRNNGIIIGAHTMDSLIFSPGKSYQLDATKSQIVKEYFQVIGNNCLSISLSSTLLGQKSKVIMNGGIVVADFVEMLDQIAEGTTNFFAGNNSNNINNSNTGWLFESGPDYIEDGILGKDIVLCKAATIELDGRTFSPEETYLWSNGSTDPTLTIDQSGTYWVALRYGDNCLLRDTINILDADDFTVDLPDDTSLCIGDTLILNPEIVLEGINYLWQDSSSNPSFVVQESGEYKVTLELTGCMVSDSLVVTYLPSPPVNLGSDLWLCPNQTFVLDASLPDITSYSWQNGSSSPTILVNTSGEYIVEVFDGRCFGKDTVLVTYNEPFNLQLGNDTTICEGDEFIITPTLNQSDNINFSWQNGSLANTFATSTEGLFWVEATRNGCSERDSISVSLKSLPRFELGQDINLCQGEQALLEVDIENANYLWYDNSTSSTVMVENAGSYWLQIEKNGCYWTDSINVIIINPEKPNLGTDTLICNNTQIILQANINSNSFVWQDGSKEKSFKVMAPGEYTLTNWEGDCSSSDTIFISYQSCIALKTYIPNAFSPNGDGINETFKPLFTPGIEIKDYLFKIFDRWGNLIFETNDIDSAWDGSYRGKNLQQGVYLYFIFFNYKDDFKEDFAKYSGDIQLAR